MTTFDDFPDGSPGTTKTGIQYLGEVPHARIPKRGPFGVDMPGITTKGYKKGDQVKLLPKNGGDLAALQQAMYQAGYLSKGEYKRMVLGSPDQVTTAAFAKVLATANMSGTRWQDALGARLAAAAYAPQEAEEKAEPPPLQIALTNPDDIKAIAQQAARNLNGTYMDDAQVNSFVQAYQAQERAYQTQDYNELYNLGGGENYYGPGGELTKPATGSGLELQLEEAIRNAKPNEVGANAFTAHFNTLMGAITQNASAPKLTA